MPFKLADRVRETSITTGTGALTLAGAVSGFRRFADVLGSGDTVFYTAVLGPDFESGVGTFTAPDQLARTAVLESSNGGSAVNFGSGVKNVFVTLPAKGLAQSAAEFFGNLLGRVATIAGLWNALKPVDWGPISGTYTPSLSAFLNATATVSGSLTLANPTNVKGGEAGEILFTMGAANLTISYGSAWKSTGATPTAPTASGAQCVLSYRVFDASNIVFTLSKLGA